MLEWTAVASIEEEDECEAQSAAELCGAVIRFAIYGNSAMICALSASYLARLLTFVSRVPRDGVLSVNIWLSFEVSCHLWFVFVDSDVAL